MYVKTRSVVSNEDTYASMNIDCIDTYTDPHIQTHIYRHTCIYATHTHSYTHEYMHTWMHTHTYTYIHTHLTGYTRSSRQRLVMPSSKLRRELFKLFRTAATPLLPILHLLTARRIRVFRRGAWRCCSRSCAFVRSHRRWCKCWCRCVQ